MTPGLGLGPGTRPRASILPHREHHHAPAFPYRATEAASFFDRVPEQQRIRLPPVRAYGADGIRVGAEVAPGAELEAPIERFFRRP